MFFASICNRCVIVMLAAAVVLGLPSGVRAGTPPENLARTAKAAASSEHSAKYAARFACDGEVPAPMDHGDIGKAWVARGNKHPEGVWFTLEWPQPVTVAEIVYYGRTGFTWSENWKDYEVYADAGAEETKKPIARSAFKAGHGPQRIQLTEPVRVTRLRLKFLSSYGGPNPGASEIQVYAVSPPNALLGKFFASSADAPDAAPPPPEIKQSPELAAKLKAGALGFSKLLVVQRHHIRCSHVYTYHCEGQRDGGGLYLYDPADGSLKCLLDSKDGQILGCDLSYDGKEILFSWRRKESPLYQLWRIGVDGTGLRQLTREDDGHNYDGCWLPDGGIVFLSTRCPQAAYCFFTPVGILYRMNADGSSQQRISGNYLNDFTPAVLNDGRIIYGRWEYVDRPAIPIQSLWTINPDGTMLQGFYGNRVLDPATFIEPQPIPGSDAILCTLTGHNGSCRGAIGIVDRRLGDNAQESMRNLTPEVPLRGVELSSNGPRGPYQTPYPVDGKYFLVSHDGTILLRDYDGHEQAIVLPPRELGFYNPRPVRARPVPPVRPAIVTAQSSEPAVLCLQDIYNGLEPAVKRGEVAQLCVVEELARRIIDSPGVRDPAFGFQRVLVSCGATYVPKKVLGYVKVEPDGSACFKVPAGVPIYFMALDAQGRALQRMRSFTHLMGGETQGCVGCHEPRLQRSPPRGLLRALARKPQELQPPEWGVRGFDYASIVQPVLDQHCVKCHNALESPNGLDLTGDRTDYFNVSYEVLARQRQGRAGSPYISWIPTYNGHEANILQIEPRTWGSPVSKLADLLFAGHPGKDGKPRVALDENARRRLLAWMDLNVPYYGTADTTYPELKACRRLFPADLPRVMDEVYARRCASCHAGQRAQIPKPWQARGEIHDPFLRVTNPHLNQFLLAPLAKAAGGTQRCGQPVFAGKDDPDYRAVLKTFEPVEQLIKDRPRNDMLGGLLSTAATGKF
ncbi:MAG: discoidin domain-containing protein [Verrucomicrobia bacterium]|nr:discoidin domain-containing protein [Verrucomicrobiota bacterium]